MNGLANFIGWTVLAVGGVSLLIAIVWVMLDYSLRRGKWTMTFLAYCFQHGWMPDPEKTYAGDARFKAGVIECWKDAERNGVARIVKENGKAHYEWISPKQPKATP